VGGGGGLFPLYLLLCFRFARSLDDGLFPQVVYFFLFFIIYLAFGLFLFILRVKGYCSNGTIVVLVVYLDKEGGGGVSYIFLRSNVVIGLPLLNSG